jgi:F0F1-type ATP synthase membrane subunit c/vacuolar-type H+-ATPase subunit K
MILLGFKYLSAGLVVGLPLLGVAIGVGIIFSHLLISISRNPSLSNTFIRWSFIAFSLVEVSGFIGIIFSFLLLFALEGYGL